MKVHFAFAFLALLSFPILSTACDCLQGPSAQSSLSAEYVDVVFRGKVVKELKSDDEFMKKYVVRVWRIFKGCSFKEENIIVTTASDSAMCGVNLAVGGNSTYVFSGYSMPMDVAALAQLGKNSKVAYTVEIEGCDYTNKWEYVTESDKNLLRQHFNQCEKCASGADCPDTSYYCDTGKCVKYDAPCPADTPMAKCMADPCTMSKPCTEATCVANYCGGCNVIWVDPNGSRVCNQ
jgi:hypothetical protein